MDLEGIAGPSWAGWSTNNGMIYAPEWRQGITPGEIRAMPYLRAIEADHLRQGRELAAERRRSAALARLAGFYRANLVRESRFGLAFLSVR
jgi:hypothetical protein